MEIRTVEFESRLVITLDGKQVVISPFPTQEHGHIKLGIKAPHDIQINREEVYLRKQNRLKPK
jgi:carbon storage regulator